MLDKTRNTLINVYIKESNGATLKADLCKDDSGSHFVRYYINDNLIKTEDYAGKSVFYAQEAIENWLSGIKTLNG